MTTKKQRRERVAEKRAEYDAESRRLGLEAQRRDHAKRSQKKGQDSPTNSGRILQDAASEHEGWFG